MLHTRNETTPDTTPDERLADILKAARRAGADAAEAVWSENRALSVGVRKGEVETVERDENRDLGLRVFVGQRTAVVSVSEFSPQTLNRLVERAVAMARLAPEDPFASLADPDLLYRGGAEDLARLDLFDATTLSAEALQVRALEAEAAGIAAAANLQSDGASAGFTDSHGYFQTTGGFSGHYATTLFFQSGRFIATDAEGRMERDGEGRSTRHLSDLPAAAETGLTGANRALSALGAQKISSRKTAVIFDNRMSRSLIGQFIGAISGASVARGSSFLKDKLGQSVFAKGITISDDPFRVRGMGSCLHDDEGVTVQKRNLIEDGVLTTWLLNTAAGKQLGLSSTGHASRSLAGPAGVGTHNVTLLAGEASQAELMRDAGNGVLITSMFGPAVNNDTGDWSAGAAGFLFENGVIVHPVNEITVAGNLIDIFARLIPGSDLDIKSSLDAPSVLIDGLSIGGK